MCRAVFLACCFTVSYGFFVGFAESAYNLLLWIAHKKATGILCGDVRLKLFYCGLFLLELFPGFKQSWDLPSLSPSSGGGSG